MNTNIIDFINPLSPSYKAYDAFKDLNFSQKIATFLVTFVATILSFGVATTPIFRILVGKIKEIKVENNPLARAVNQVAEAILIPVQDTQLAFTPLPLEPPFSLNPVNIPAPVSPPLSISPRTTLLRRKLLQILKERNQHFIETPCNADSFYAAFAISIGRHLNWKVEAQKIRRIVKKEALKIHVENPLENWIRTFLKKEYASLITYEQYLQRVHECAKDAKAANRPPINGMERLDGVLLCRRFKVNLHVVEIIPQVDKPESLNDIAVGDYDYPQNEEFNARINIALYNNHYDVHYLSVLANPPIN